MVNGLPSEEIASFQGAENARIILIALFCLSVYEWLITLDDEIKYFWNGPWGMSRILFLVNRYFCPATSVVALFCVSLPNPSFEVCKRGIQTLFIVSIIALGVIQATLVIRVWYLFAQSRLMRTLMIVSFFFTNFLSLYYAFMEAIQLKITPNLTTLHIHGCRATRPDRFWRLWLPSLVLHTLLYSLTAFKAIKNRRTFKQTPMLKRLVRDGGFFYFVVFLSVLLTTIGSFLQQYPQINIPAIFSNFVVVTSSIAASRVMLSIHSLAAKLGSDSAWLLNNIELSRVPWRPGAKGGEIIVDRYPRNPFDDEEDEDLDDLDSQFSGFASLKTSRAGRLNDETW
ncbi:hypothetical protein R3P38DRAFT_3382404 [Favolaschia claudopus]|uniref:DUF6533 domain-containing protein n=1 Tax=Favolaschia claudopus TaxID=2862362 RepID=A0AAW0EFY6_9AGAR